MIGVFDSGYGGLTVLRALVDALPDRRFVYLGDHARAPYGDRAPDEIFELTRSAVDHLFSLGCRLVILACNTAAALALRRLQHAYLPEAYPDRRVLGVLVPMVEAITGVPWMAAERPSGADLTPPRTVAVFATRQTVLSRAYPREIAKRAPAVIVIQQACPRLVSLIEAEAPRPRVAAAVRRYVDALAGKTGGQSPDVVMLGCTHYPLIADLFAAALPGGVEILCQPTVVARSLAVYLQNHPEFAADGTAPPSLSFHTSGAAARVSHQASLYFGRPVRFRPLAAAADGVDNACDGRDRVRC